MRNFSIFAALLLSGFAALSCAQDRVFDWTPANSETIPMEPASLHAGRVYHPAAGGGNMHIGIEARIPSPLPWSGPTNGTPRCSIPTRL